VLVLTTFIESSTVPAWCWHDATMEAKIVLPSDTGGMYFELPGEIPFAHTLPSFIWPGASFLVYIENVADTTQSRVKMVNSTEECVQSTYEDALPVVKNSSAAEQTIYAYLAASPLKRLFCFFELPTSSPMPINGAGGGDLRFSEPQAPDRSLVVDGVVNSFMNRGLTSNVILTRVAQNENAQAFILADTAFAANDNQCLPAVGMGRQQDEPESAEDYIERVAAVTVKAVSVLPSPMQGATHFVTLNEEDTLKLTIGVSYTLCYVGSSLDTTRVFNKIGQSLEVRDIITMLRKADVLDGDAATSKQINLVLQASLSGYVDCMATTKRWTVLLRWKKFKETTEPPCRRTSCQPSKSLKSSDEHSTYPWMT